MNSLYQRLAPDTTGVTTRPRHRPGRARLTNAMLPGLARMLDSTVLVLTGLVAYAGYLELWQGLRQDLVTYLLTTGGAALLWLVLPTQPALFSLGSIRDYRRSLRLLLARWTTVMLLLIVAGFAFKISASFSRAWVASWFVLALAGLIVGRWTISRLIAHGYTRGTLLERIALIGATPQAEVLLDHLNNTNAPKDYQVVGIFDDRTSRRPSLVRAVPVVGTIEDLITACQEGAIDSIIVCLPWTAHKHLIHILTRLKAVAVDVRLSADSAVFLLNAVRLSRLANMPLVEVLDRPLKGWQSAAKAVEDYLIAGLGTLLLAPVLLLIALAIKLDSPGPVLFRQPRFGFNNRRIWVMKFRTMYVDKGDVTGAQRTVKGDPRVTRVGAILRRLSLDELPQLLNVLRGEMSIVGPRAHAVAMKVGEQYYYDAFHDYAARHRVKPGITGWAQVNGLRGEVDTVQKAKARLEYDLHYIENWSIAFDLAIIALTVLKAPLMKNAY